MNDFLSKIWQACGDDASGKAAGDTVSTSASSSSPASIRCAMPLISIEGHGSLPSVFPVSDLAAGAVASAGAATAEWINARFGVLPAVQVDRRLSSLWFATTIAPQGWALEATWNAVAGDYATRDGWIKLHTNARHHRDAALKVLGVGVDKAAVRAAVSTWSGDDLEHAIIEAGGCAARLRSMSLWAAHPQGLALQGKPLVEIVGPTLSDATRNGDRRQDGVDRLEGVRRDRPLAGVRVLDLTRVLAGPVCTRFLAGLGADVLRIDPQWWQEAGLEPETTPGKRCATLDLRSPRGLARLRELITQADVLVHGWRPGALAGLGLDDAERRRLNPMLVDVSLNAYGWHGPWQGRRGFDSLVQMSTGIAHEGMVRSGADHPVPLPVQALDHATGYILACAALRGLTRRLNQQTPTTARASLVQTAALLVAGERQASDDILVPAQADDYADAIELTAWGPAKRLKPPLHIAGCPLHWEQGARRFRSDPVQWSHAAP